MLPVRPMIHLSGSGFGQKGSISNFCVSCARSDTEMHATSANITAFRILTSGVRQSMSRIDGPGGCAVEEVDHAGFERVFGANDDEAVMLDEALQNLRAM